MGLLVVVGRGGREGYHGRGRGRRRRRGWQRGGTGRDAGTRAWVNLVHGQCTAESGRPEGRLTRLPAVFSPTHSGASAVGLGDRERRWPVSALPSVPPLTVSASACYIRAIRPERAQKSRNRPEHPILDAPQAVLCDWHGPAANVPLANQKTWLVWCCFRVRYVASPSRFELRSPRPSSLLRVDPLSYVAIFDSRPSPGMQKNTRADASLPPSFATPLAHVRHVWVLYHIDDHPLLSLLVSS